MNEIVPASLRRDLAFLSTVAVVASLVLASCGGSSHKNSTSIVTHLLTTNELPGFKGSRPSVYNTASGWLEQQTGSNQVAASETEPLTRLGFVAAASENLNGPSGNAGLSLVEQFKTPGGARSELADVLTEFKATVPGYEPFPVPGIPGAFGYAAAGPGLNLVFASGDYYYLVGEFVSAVSPRSEATLIAAAKSFSRRVHG
jgi:hypothetical protein